MLGTGDKAKTREHGPSPQISFVEEMETQTEQGESPASILILSWSVEGAALVFYMRTLALASRGFFKS